MSPTFAIWLTSAVGAALFFLAGLFSAKKRHLAFEGFPVPAPATIPVGEHRARADMIALQSESLAKDQVIQQLRSEVDLLKQQNATGDVTDANTLVTESTVAELRKLQGELTKARQAEQQLAAAKNELEIERKRTRELQASLQKKETEQRDLVIRSEAQRGIEAERNDLRNEHVRARQQIQELETRLQGTEDAAVVQGLERELAALREVTKARQEEAVRIQEENANLRLVASETSDWKDRAKKLEDENRDLRAQGFLAKTKSIPSMTAPSAAGLQGAVNRLSQISAVRSAVVSDAQGFVVASAGDHAEPMAAFAAYLADAAKKARDMLPLAPTSQVTIQDAQNVTLAVRPLEGAHAELVLVTLATTPNLGEPEIRQALAG